MEEATDLACIICCSSDCEDFQGLTFHLSGEEDEEEGDNRYNKWVFKQFCSQLLSIQSLQLERSLSVCSTCLDDLTRVVDTKSKVDAVESRVRKLQRSILMELKELQGFMSTLKEQLKKIENSAKRSDTGEAISCGQQQRMSRMKRGQMNICEEENGAIFFRKLISNVTTNLHTFCGDLSKRFPNRPVNTASGTTDQINNGGDTEDFKSVSSQPTNYEWHNPEVEGYDDEDVQESGSGINSPALSDDKDSIPLFRSEGNNKLILFDRDDDDQDNIGATKQCQRNSRKSIAQSRNYKGRSPARRPKKVRAKVTRSVLTRSQGKPDSYCSLMKEAEQGLGKRKRASSKKSIVSMKKILLSKDDHCDEVDDDDRNDDDYDPVSSADENFDADDSEPEPDYEKFNIKIQKNPALEQIDFTGMTIFRKYVIGCLLNQIIFHVQKPENDESADPDSVESCLRQAEVERMSALIEYDPKHDKLHMNGVEILINEEEKTVACSECSYKYTIKWPVDDAKKERRWLKKRGRERWKFHMLNNHHAKVFNCPLCPSSSEKTCGYKLPSYIRHLKSHMHALPSHPCTICGRPLSSLGNLKTHLRTHMSMEEKEEFDAVNVQPVFMCATCGKTFRRQSDLKNHQKTHLPKELKQMLCPSCGTIVKTSSYQKHLDKVCGKLVLVETLGTTRIKCDFCESTLSSHDSLTLHIKRMHSEDAQNRSFRCHECPKSFKAKWDLIHHMELHAGLTYNCDKGCGKVFGTKRYCQRHQNKCKGVQRDG